MTAPARRQLARPSKFLVVAIGLVCVIPPTPKTQVADELLEGIQAIDSKGNPASMIVWGDARALVVGPDGTIFAAASKLGAGRVAVLGHGGFLENTDVDSAAFAANAVEWLAGRSGHRSRAPLAMLGLTNSLAAELERRLLRFRPIGEPVSRVDLKAVDVIVGSPQQWAKAGRLAELERWLRAGNGLLVTETAWGMLQLHPDLSVDTLAANLLLEQAGVRFTSAAHSAYSTDGTYSIDRSILEVANADVALAVIAGTEQGDPVYAAKVLGRAMEQLPLDSSLIAAAMEIARQRRSKLDAAYRQMAEKPLSVEEDPLALTLMDLDARMAAENPPRELREHASAVVFPGKVVGKRLERASCKIELEVPGWHTTGLYAPPGELLTVTVPEAMDRAGLAVQIGAWLDPHRHWTRSRLKRAFRRFDVDSRITAVASAIGGPIYIDVPSDLDPRAYPATIDVEIRGTVRAPHFELGVTDLDAWRSTIRHHGAPWAEIESRKLIFTVPSAAIREVDRPDLVMQHWDRVHQAMQTLEPRTANHWADRPYRYVADASVSWGFMYCPADSPIVIPLSEAPAMLVLANFDAEGPNELWGHYHEMGHAHQNPLWTDAATTEVTVNIFTVCALHEVNGYPLDSVVTRSDPATAWQTFDQHRQAGRPFEAVGGPFPRLQMYALLWHRFGFDAFRETFRRIRRLSPEQRSATPTNERNTFLLQFSKVVGRNLAPYFDAWGIEVLDETRMQLQSLPSWLPKAPAGSDDDEDS